MKQIMVAVVLTATLLGGAAFAESSQERADQLRQLLSYWHGPQRHIGQSALAVSFDQPLKCGTPVVLAAQYLEEKHGNTLGLTQFLARPSDTDFPEKYVSPAGHFKVHYTTAVGNDQTNLSYVEIVALIADSVWAHHIDELGYHEPLNDGDYPWGGDSLYDIYISYLGPNYYGITWGEIGPGVGNGYQATSYMELQPDYSIFRGYEDRPLDALRVTLAHEFFHAVQFWYDAREHEDETVENTDNYSWLEMSSVWMEEETFDYVNDYYYYLPHYIPKVHQSLRFWDPGSAYPYGAVLFNIYLTETFGRDIMKDIWERCAAVPKANAWYGAIDEAVRQASGGSRSFEDAFAEYSRWLFFTGDRKPHFFEEGANYYMIPRLDTLGVDYIRPYIRYYSEYPAAVNRDFAFFPDYLGANYLVFDVTGVDSGITVDNFFGVISSPQPVGWRISVMGYNRFDANVPVRVADSVYRNRDEIVIKDLDGITDVVLVPVCANPFYSKYSNVYQFTMLGAITPKSVTQFLPPYPNPLRLSEQKILTMEVILSSTVGVDVDNNAQAHLDVYTVAGERIYSTSETGSPNGRVWLDWNGRNEAGAEVASGVYVLLVRVDDQSETFKALVIR